MCMRHANQPDHIYFVISSFERFDGVLTVLGCHVTLINLFNAEVSPTTKINVLFTIFGQFVSWLVGWLVINTRQHRKVNLCQLTAGEGNWLSRLRMANCMLPYVT